MPTTTADLAFRRAFPVSTTCSAAVSTLTVVGIIVAAVGEIDTAEANYWILGGHSDRTAHQGADARGVPRWIWNAHHTMFDAESLRELVSRCGFTDLEIFTYDIRNLRCYALRAP